MAALSSNFGISRVIMRSRRRLLLFMNPGMSKIRKFPEQKQIIASEAFRVLPILTIFVTSIELCVVERVAILAGVLENRR
jgi:hypothetical protein